jgi:hypothetical protein
MNLTLDQYIAGLERSVRGLASVLGEWEELDEELRSEYVEQLLWMLRVRPDVLSRAMREGDARWFELSERVAAATARLFEMRGEIAEKMGVTIERIVPYATYTATESGPTAMAV